MPFPELGGKDSQAVNLRLLAGKKLLACMHITASAGDDDQVYIGLVMILFNYRDKRLSYKLKAESIVAY